MCKVSKLLYEQVEYGLADFRISSALHHFRSFVKGLCIPCAAVQPSNGPASRKPSKVTVTLLLYMGFYKVVPACTYLPTIPTCVIRLQPQSSLTIYRQKVGR